MRENMPTFSSVMNRQVTSGQLSWLLSWSSAYHSGASALIEGSRVQGTLGKSWCSLW